MDEARPLILIADGSSTIGLGHLFRILALGIELRGRGWPVRLLSRGLSEIVRETYGRAGIEVTGVPGSPDDPFDLPTLLEAVRDDGAGAPAGIVTDAYKLTPPMLEALRAAAGGVLCAIDDEAKIAFPADLVVNPNLFAVGLRYKKGPRFTRFMVGTRYALLRPEFARPGRPAGLASAASGQGGGASPALSILITLGGADTEEDTPRVVRALARVGVPLRATAIVGPAAGRVARSAEEAAAEARERGVEIALHASVSDMADRIRDADLVVGAGGVTLYEAAALGRGSILLPASAGERLNARAAAAAGFAVDLGPPDSTRPERLARALETLCRRPRDVTRMGARGLALVNARGASTVAYEFLSLVKARAAA